MPWAAAGLLAQRATCLYARAALPEVYASAPALRAGIRRAAGRARATRGGGVVVYASARFARGSEEDHHCSNGKKGDRPDGNARDCAGREAFVVVGRLCRWEAVDRADWGA